MTVTNIAEFLTARLDEDQSTAETAGGNSWHTRGLGVEIDIDELDSPRGVADCFSREAAQYIARHDPARVLREVAAKRALLAEHGHAPAVQQDYSQSHDFGCVTCHNDTHCDETMALGWCDTIRIMASVFADHSDYDESWRP